MRLSRRITLMVVLCIVAGHAGSALIRLYREISYFESEVRDDGHQLGRGVAGAAAREFQHGGAQAARDLVAYVNDREPQVELRWVWLDAPAGDPAAPHADAASLAKVAAGQELARRIQSEGSADFIQTYVPVPLQGPRKAAIELEQRLDDEQRYIRHTVWQVLLSTLLIVGAAAAVVFWFSRRYIGTPVRLLHEKAQRIGRGDLSGDLDVKQADEIGDLAAEINAMCHRLEEAQTARAQAVDKLRHADRLSTIGTLAAGIAHEIGTPLAVVRGHAQMITDEASGELRDNARHIQEQTARIESIIRALLDFARLKPAQREPVDLTAVTRQALQLVEPIARRSSIELRLLSDEPAPARVDSFQVQQVITNLVVNSIQAMPHGGTISVELEKAEGAIALRVRDEGPGIPPGDEQRIFEPFYTTKPPGMGTGLGLSIAQEIVREHGGTIAASSVQGKGSTFTIRLPAGLA